MAEAPPSSSSLEELCVLANIRLVQRRALMTAVVVALIGVLLAGWIWWQTRVTALPGVDGASVTPHEAELADRLRLVTEQLALSMRLFAVTLFVVGMGVVVLIASYARQMARLVELLERRIPPDQRS